MDIRDPENLIEVGSWNFTSQHSRAIEIMGDRAFLSADSGELFVINISDPTNLRFHGKKYSGYLYRHLLPMGEMLVAMDGYSGGNVDILQVYQHKRDLTRRNMYSINIFTDTEPLYLVRATSTHVGKIEWTLHVEGTYVYYAGQETQWLRTENPGQNVAWTATLDYAPGTNSAASELVIEWLYEIPLIQSAVVLAGKQGVDAVTAREIASYDFQGDLVVLSGCSTFGEHRVLGEGWFGLPRSFLAAGARSVISTLWDVDDKGARQFVTAFYGALHSGMARDKALVKAREICQSNGMLPRDWAAFVLTGVGSESVPVLVRAESEKRENIHLALVIFLSVVVVGTWFFRRRL